MRHARELQALAERHKDVEAKLASARALKVEREAKTAEINKNIDRLEKRASELRIIAVDAHNKRVAKEEVARSARARADALVRKQMVVQQEAQADADYAAAMLAKYDEARFWCVPCVRFPVCL
jgi:hypothetical protein